MPTRRERPNVLVFFTDQQRWDSVGLHGNPLGLTPNLDRLARRGTHVPNAFTPQPVCAPTRACLQTGVYPTTSGVYRNTIPLRQDIPTIAGQFNAAGYHTGYIGKWHLASRDPVPPDERGGYQSWLAANLLEFCSDEYHTVLYNEEEQAEHLPGYRADALGDAAIRFVDAHQQEPFFLFMSFLEPHHQNHRDDYPAPNGYAERYAGRWTPPDLAALGGSAPQHLGGYWGMVKRLDEVLGRVLDALESLGILDDTIVAFTSDHGCHFKTRNSEYKRSCHDASIRIPLALQGPGFDAGGSLPELVSLIDLPPTLLDAAGLPVPEGMQGRSFLPLTRGSNTERPEDWPEEVFVQISESQVGRAIRTHRWKYSVSAPDRDGWTDSGSDRYVEEFLYDLQADPYELVNLAGLENFQDTSADLRERLKRRMVEAGEPEPTIDLAPPRRGNERGLTPDVWLRSGFGRRSPHLP
ncbi:MAG: sulfatase-like hydrolase/transferase [Chloroflexi bacterium]|nr:sulfatase-like hydrolase/transferase [Chloroflexota bacterium]